VKALRHLPKMDVMGKCDPYVTFTLGEQGPYQSSIKFKVCTLLRFRPFTAPQLSLAAE